MHLDVALLHVCGCVCKHAKRKNCLLHTAYDRGADDRNSAHWRGGSRCRVAAVRNNLMLTEITRRRYYRSRPRRQPCCLASPVVGSRGFSTLAVGVHSYAAELAERPAQSVLIGVRCWHVHVHVARKCSSVAVKMRLVVYGNRLQLIDC